MAIVEKHQYQRHQQQQNKEEQAAKKAKDFLLTSLRRRRRRKISNSKSCNEENLNGSVDAVKQEEISHSSMQKQAMYDSNVVVTVVSNRKPSSDYNSGDVTTNAITTTLHQPGGNVKRVIATTAAVTVQQCHCVTCYKSDKVAIVNNVATTLTQSLNKYILRIQSQGDCATATPITATVNNEEKYQNYQCPTGKLCCLKNVNVMSHVVNNPTPIPSTAMTNNNLSAAIKQIQGQEQLDRVYNFQKTLTNEWDILAHLTEDHQLPVQQYYGEYGQRIYVQCVTQQLSIACLNLKGTENLDSKVEKFFIACIPLEMYSSSIVASKIAIFVYHMNTATTFTFSNLKDEVSNFETIIENPLTGIKWFGCAHPLTTPWSLILEKQHFLEYNVLSSHQHHRLSAVSVSVNQAAEMEADVIEADTFVFIIKRKLETKTKS